MAEGGERDITPSNSKMEENAVVWSAVKNSKELVSVRNTKLRSICEHPPREDAMSSKALLPDRLDFIKSDINQKLTHSCINRIVHCNRSSTELRYQEQYAEFFNYISIFYNINRFPFSAVINFFNSLIDRNLAYQTILNYRSALTKPVEILFELHLCNVKPLNDLLKFVKSHHIKPKDSFVPWSIDKTLLMLENPPASYINDLFICKKAFFLCLLADPRRVAETCALTISKSNFSSDSVTLRVHSGFIAKNATATYNPQEIVIPSFQENPSLCPVKNLKDYLHLTDEISRRLNKKRPDFLWVDLQLKPLTQKVCRDWIRSIIFLADPSATVKNTKFHSMRGIVASALDFNGCSFKQILKRTYLTWLQIILMVHIHITSIAAHFKKP